MLLKSKSDEKKNISRKILRHNKNLSVDIKTRDIYYSLPDRQIILNDNASITIDGDDYSIEKIGKGGNSCIYKLVGLQDKDNKLAIKISSFYSNDIGLSRIKRTSGTRLGYIERRVNRFKHEVEALNKAKESNFNDYIVKIITGGSIELPIGNVNTNSKTKHFPFYTMELADESLQDYLANKNNRLALQQKVLLFEKLTINLIKLHDLGIYHRDIKAENILRFNDVWKIGDLGLIDYRYLDIEIDIENEKIGPVCRLSPEATNKHLGKDFLKDYETNKTIDEYSDLYQLGLLFWFICQGEIPVGSVNNSDFYYYDTLPDLFDNILFSMLQFSKKRRQLIGLNTIKEKIEELKQPLGI